MDGTTIRGEKTGDHEALRSLLLEAFPGPDEADLVERLRAAGDAEIALVAEAGGQIAGQVMFSRMKAPFSALGLAPVAVDQRFRRHGIAAGLISAGLERAREEGWQGVFVLGEPGYYARFGFSAEMAAGFASPYAGPYLMALPLQGAALPAASGRIDYAPAFAALG
jgi:putative acetyltransferase